MSKSVLNKKEFETLSHFRYQLRRFLRISETITHNLGITNLQYLLLLHIRGYQGRSWASIGELAERLQSHHHGVVSLVTRCEKLGLVCRQQSESDRRIIEVHLSAEGEKLVGQIAAKHREELLSLQGIFKVPVDADLLAKADAEAKPRKPSARSKK